MNTCLHARPWNVHMMHCTITWLRTDLPHVSFLSHRVCTDVFEPQTMLHDKRTMWTLEHTLHWTCLWTCQLQCPIMKPAVCMLLHMRPLLLLHLKQGYRCGSVSTGQSRRPCRLWFRSHHGQRSWTTRVTWSSTRRSPIYMGIRCHPRASGMDCGQAIGKRP